MPAIYHMHSRFIDAPLARVRCLLEALWSGQPGDAFPYDRIRPWRRAAPGGRGFSQHDRRDPAQHLPISRASRCQPAVQEKFSRKPSRSAAGGRSRL